MMDQILDDIRLAQVALVETGRRARMHQQGLYAGAVAFHLTVVAVAMGLFIAVITNLG